MPGWMIVIVIFLIISLIGALFNATKPTMLFGFSISGILGMLINGILIIALLLIVIGIFTREAWAWKLALVYFGFLLINGVVSGIATFINFEAAILQIAPEIEASGLGADFLPTLKIKLNLIMQH